MRFLLFSSIFDKGAERLALYIAVQETEIFRSLDRGEFQLMLVFLVLSRQVRRRLPSTSESIRRRQLRKGSWSLRKRRARTRRNQRVERPRNGAREPAQAAAAAALELTGTPPAAQMKKSLEHQRRTATSMHICLRSSVLWRSHWIRNSRC
jgi:hypothetical protein